MKFTNFRLSQIIREEIAKAAPLGSGMEQADLDDEKKKLIGHT